jgi:hypothetical protein
VPRRSESDPASHAWIFDLLFSGRPTVTWAAAGKLPAGFDRTDQFAVLPAIGGRRFAVSLSTRAGASSALTSYNALRTAPRRLVRDAFSLGLRTGLAQPLIWNKIDIGAASAATTDELTGDLLTEYLSRLFGQGPVVVAFGVGLGPYRKPVLQVFSAGGTPLSYVKIGWNDWTRKAVCAEAAALHACASRSMRIGVPELLDHSTWHGLELLVTAPLPRDVRRLGQSSRLPEAALLREISQLSHRYAGELGASPWWQALRTRISNGVADSTARAQLEHAADGIERSYCRTALEFGSWHGDLVPWNMARLGGQVYVWDWESFAPDAPIGFDALHYCLQVAFVARKSPLAKAAILASQHARPALDALGVAENIQDLVAALHLMELFVRHEEARSSTGAIDDRFYPVVAHLLERSLAAPLGFDSVERIA